MIRVALCPLIPFELSNYSICKDGWAERWIYKIIYGNIFHCGMVWLPQMIYISLVLSGANGLMALVNRLEFSTNDDF